MPRTRWLASIFVSISSSSSGRILCHSSIAASDRWHPCQLVRCSAPCAPFTPHPTSSSLSLLPCPGPPSEGSTLLLYTLLHGSRSFREYCLVRSDVETLLLPVLGALYGVTRAHANHLYMLQVGAGARGGLGR